MKKFLTAILFAFQAALFAAPYLPQNGETYMEFGGKVYLFGGPAVESNGVAAKYDDPVITAWATGHSYVRYGSAMGDEVTQKWRVPERGYKASKDNMDVVCIGDGGEIILTFDKPIVNGAGADFVVFENGFDSSYLELAFVEVSHDGINFVRFPNFYLGTVQTDVMSAQQIYNLGSKYENKYGTAYDLSELLYAWCYANIDGSSFSQAYIDHLNDMMPYLTLYTGADPLPDDYLSRLDEFIDLFNIDTVNYVRIYDIVGDGRERDSAGNPIYDPLDGTESRGFDLNGVGVINEGSPIIPEPAHYAAVMGIFMLVFAFLKRRKS